MLRADRQFVQWCEHFGKLGGEYWNTERRRRMLATVTRARRLGQSLLQANGATIVGSAGSAVVVQMAVSPPIVLGL